MMRWNLSAAMAALAVAASAKAEVAMTPSPIFTSGNLTVLFLILASKVRYNSDFFMAGLYVKADFMVTLAPAFCGITWLLPFTFSP